MAFVLYGDGMTDKPFKTLDEQLEILEKRNLIIANKESAKIVLKRYGYYEVINGYKRAFMLSDNDDDGFKSGIAFERLARLQEFDRNIRFGVVASLEIFEENLRQALAYVIAENISHIQSEYINRRKYNTGRRYRDKKTGKLVFPIDNLIRVMNIISRSSKQPIKHYREKHGNVPPWILVKELTFGNLVWLVHLLKKKEKNEVISIMFGMEVNLVEVLQQKNIKGFFHEVLLLFLSYRNTAAHGGRMYNHISKKFELSYNSFFHPVMDVDQAMYRTGKGKSSIGTIIKILRLFDDRNPFITLEVTLDYEIEKYLKTYAEDHDYLCDEMQYTPRS